MKKIKTYFSRLSDFSQTKEWLLEEMTECEITELRVNEAKRMVGSEFYFCKAILEHGERNGNYSCGKLCSLYNPRNGKSGCCKHRSFCYESGKEYLLTINGKLLPIFPF